MNRIEATENLLKAVDEGDLDAMRQALDAGADVNEHGPGRVLVAHASGPRRGEVVHVGLGRGRMAVIQWGGGPSLMRAIASGNLDGARLLLDRGGSVDDKDYQGVTALMVAAFLGNDRGVRLLLEAGADVNATDEEGSTALIGAARRGHTEAARYLLQYGADVRAAELNGTDALACAENYEHWETAHLIRAAMAARELQASLPAAPASQPSQSTFENLGAPDPQPVRSNRPRL